MVLLANHCDVNVQTDGFTPLHLAAKNNFREGVKVLLAQPSVKVNSERPKDGLTPLITAIVTDAVKMTDQERANLVQCFVDDSRCELCKEDKGGWMALTYAGKLIFAIVGYCSRLLLEMVKLYTTVHYWVRTWFFRKCSSVCCAYLGQVVYFRYTRNIDISVHFNKFSGYFVIAFSIRMRLFYPQRTAWN